MTVAEAERMSTREYQEWMAYWDLYPPFDHWEAFGKLCCLIINPWLPKGQKPHKPTDFMPAAYSRKAKPPRQTQAQLRATMAMLPQA